MITGAKDIGVEVVVAVVVVERSRADSKVAERSGAKWSEVERSGF